MLVMIGELLSWFWSLVTSFTKSNDKVDTDDAYRTVDEVIQSRGFKCEVHEVTTPDGYILTLHRIVHPRRARPGKPVLLMHGFGSNASCWVTAANDGYLETSNTDTNSNNSEPDSNSDKFDNCLGFCLARRNYDVWLASMRACRYSRRHRTLSFDSSAYWDFTLDDMVEQDMPTIVDYIIRETDSNSLSYVGISLGTTLMFGLLSSRPQYNDVIKPFVALAPCWRLYNMRSPLRYLIQLMALLWRQCPWIKPPSTSIIYEQILGRLTNSNHFFTRPLQSIFYFFAALMSGFYKKQFDDRRLGVFCAHHGLIAAPKQIIHSTQYILQDRPFAKFDYGTKKNLSIYGSNKPPIYDIAKITNKFVCFFYSLNDWATDLKDVEFAKSRLTVPLFDDYLVADPKWTHFDFQMGRDVGEIVNKRIVSVLERAYVDETPSSSLGHDYSFCSDRTN